MSCSAAALLFNQSINTNLYSAMRRMRIRGASESCLLYEDTKDTRSRSHTEQHTLGMSTACKCKIPVFLLLREALLPIVNFLYACTAFVSVFVEREDSCFLVHTDDTLCMGSSWRFGLSKHHTDMNLFSSRDIYLFILKRDKRPESATSMPCK